MMEEKRVADYFVVSGLPDNPEPLEELSEENIQKPSHKQDPIVEVAVINKTLGEAPPPKYRVVDQTPLGFPADLNHGSIRAPEIYLCYKRGREKPPITDIGVLYEGKQRVMPGCEVVYHTPYGRPANVNNSNSSRTYITFRRADETAPSDTLAVTDVCVILSNKGEIPPHAFCLIGKTLNKGMVGSDVFLCYKKSMVKANFVAYQPGLLSRYPAEDYDNFGLPETVSQFCLPLGAMVECWPAKAMHPKPVFSTFVLTGANGEKVYGSAVIFYEPFPEPLLTPALRQQLGLGDEVIQPPQPQPQQEGSLAPAATDNDNSKSVHVNKCICLLSRWPFFDTFRKFLSYLYRVPKAGPQLVPIERYISHFMSEVPFPSAQRPRILVQFNQAAISLAMPEETPLPHSGASFTTLLMCLGPEDTMNLLLYTLMEHKILIHSLRHAVLTSVAEAVANMIFPFHWQCPYIPLCPLGLSTVLNAPIPFVVGVDSRYFDLYDPPQDVTCVDLDTNTITPAEDKKGITFKWMPKRPLKVLRATMERLYTQICSEAAPADNSIDLSDEAEAIDLDFTKHRKELIMETAIQEAFIRFMASLLKGYNGFLKPITQAPTHEATGLSSLFDTQGFLKSREKAYHKFFTHLMKTQLFSRFIEERSFVSDKDASLAFFDECQEKVDESRDEPRLIELDDSHKSERTVFITPPDPVDLPQGKEYDYEGRFPTQLEPDLFLHKDRHGPSSSSSLSAGGIASLKAGGCGTCPSSPMTRRTKQEIKSAQKIAQKHVGSPELWAKCLLGHCYSLWFIHLPSYVKCVHSKTKALRTAYDVLVKMQQAKLQQPDEVCYRVLLQLCGVYSQPVLAVKVLFQMRQHGLQPNAITYGFYNKAVLESKWPTSDTNAYLQWKKLQNVVAAVAQFKQGMKSRRFSVYSNSESDCDGISRASTDSFLDDVQDKVDGAGKKPEQLESPNIEERTSTGGMSDRGYSSMTSEDAKRMSLNIGSQESLESLGKNVRPMFINRETCIQENGEGDTAAGAAGDKQDGLAELRRDPSTLVRSSITSVGSDATLRGSTCSAAGLLMTTDTSLDESVFGSGGGGGGGGGAGGDGTDAERKRHRSAEQKTPGIFRPRKLSGEFSKAAEDKVVSEGDLVDGRTSDSGDNINVKDSNDLEVDIPVIMPSVEENPKQSEEHEDNNKDAQHSALPSPSHSIRTPVTENDPLGLLSGSQTSIVDTPCTSSDVATTSIVFPTGVTSSSNTNDSGIGDMNGGGKSEPETRAVKSDSVSSASSCASSPCSPDWKPVHQSMSDQQIDSKGPPTPPMSTRTKASTLPASMSATGGVKPSSARSQVTRNDSFTGAFQAATTGLFSRFQKLKESMSSPAAAGGGSSGTLPSRGATTSSTSSLPKAHEMENHLYEEDEEKSATTGGSAQDLRTPGSCPTVSMTTYEEHVPSGYKSRMKHQLQKTSPFVSDLYKGLLSSPTVKSLQTNLAPTVKSMQAGLSSGWSTMKESWGIEAVREHEALAAAQNEAWRRAEQDIESRALESENFHSYARNAELGESGIRFAPRRAGSSKMGGTANGFPPLRDDEMRPRANTGDSITGPLSADSQDGLDNGSFMGSSASLLSASNGPVTAFFNMAVEAEMCSLSRCGACSGLLYDEEIMAGWSADDSNLNTACQFCAAKLVPFLQIYLKDYRHSSKPMMMTPSQSCESMQSIQSMPNVPLSRGTVAPPPPNVGSLPNRSMTSLNSIHSNKDDDKSPTSTSQDSKLPMKTDTTTEVVESTPNATPTKVDAEDDILSESATPTMLNGDNTIDNSPDKTLQEESTPDKIVPPSDSQESENVENGNVTSGEDKNSVTVESVEVTINESSEQSLKTDNNISKEIPQDNSKEISQNNTEAISQTSETMDSLQNAEKVEEQRLKDEHVTEDSSQSNDTEDKSQTVEGVTTEDSSTDTAVVATVALESKDSGVEISTEGEKCAESEKEEAAVKVDITVGTDTDSAESKENSPERKRSSSECMIGHQKKKEGSSSMGDLLEETGAHTSRDSRHKRFILLDPISVPYLSPLVLRKEIENVMEAEGDLCLSSPQFVDEHPILYWNLMWYFKRLEVHSHMLGFMLTARSTNKEQPPKIWQKADSRHVHIRAMWDNPRLHDELATPMYIMWNQAPHQIQPLLKEHQIFSRRLMQHVVSSIMQNDVLGPIKSVLAERRTLQRTTSHAAPVQYSMYRDILFLSFVALGHNNIDHDSFDKEYRQTFSFMNPRDVAKCKKQDKPPNHTIMYCRRRFGGLEL